METPTSHDQDWDAYLDARRAISESTAVDAGKALAQKRDCALAYLRKCAQTSMKSYSKNSVRILTPEFVQLMASINSAQRLERNLRA